MTVHGTMFYEYALTGEFSRRELKNCASCMNAGLPSGFTSQHIFSNSYLDHVIM